MPHCPPPTEDAPDAIERARFLCRSRGVQLTAQRAEVLAALLRHDAPVKAYDLLAELQSPSGRLAPMTVYRALDFLVEQHLVHRIDATHSFVACRSSSASHRAVMLVCTRCRQVQELDAAALGAPLLQEIAGAGFEAGDVEIKGICRRCAATAAAVPH